MKKRILLLSLCSLLPFSVLAENSKPNAAPIINKIPSSRDIPFNGTMKLFVDATNIDQGIMNVEQIIPINKAGPMVLLNPKWLPGKHAPRGPIDKLAGLVITANGQKLEWVRDTLDVYAFHINIPKDVKEIKVEFKYLSPTSSNQGRIEVTQEMMSLQWNNVSLYPAGYYVRQIPIQASVKLPNNWEAATALRGKKTANIIDYDVVNYEVFIDSPVLAGRYYKAVQLSDKVSLNIFADAPKYLEFNQEQIDLHKKMVEQAIKTFGTEQYDHYDFLFSLSDNLGGIGLEHHRSSENGVGADYFTNWASNISERNLLPHEFTHSWDGKFRRGKDLWTPDYRTQMQNSLLWVYEGQTQFWGYVLDARSGLFTKEQTLEAYASIAADLENRKGREWRDVLDTTNDPIISARAPKAWLTYQRSEDYYNEGMMVWIEVDAKLRELSNGNKGIDDFAKSFFGLKNGDYGQVTYDFDDVVKTLNKIAPFDWKKLLKERIEGDATKTLLNGFTMSGYKLIYNDKPNIYIKDLEGRNKNINLNYSLGLTTSTEGAITGVLWGGRAFNANLAVGDKVLAINGRSWSKDNIAEELNNAKTTKKPIQIIIMADNRYKLINFEYYEGMKYPHFEKITKEDGALDKLLMPLK